MVIGGDDEMSKKDLSNFKLELSEIPQHNLSFTNAINEAMRGHDETMQAISNMQRIKREREEQLFENSNQSLDLQRKQIQLHEAELEFMKNIDGNTQAIVEQLNSLILSAHVDEAYQANILDTLKDIKVGESYWEVAKKAVMEATIQHGVSTGFAVMAMAFKQSFLK